MPTNAKTPPKWERANVFLENLHHRIANDNGARAILRRSLSGEARQVRNTYPLLLPYLEGIPDWQQKIWMQVACLSVYYPQYVREDQSNFGGSCRRLANGSTSNGPERRFRSLLDTSLTDIWIPLTALVRQMRSESVQIDYPRLIYELCRWDHPDQYIQDQWARTFWGAPPVLQDAESDR